MELEMLWILVGALLVVLMVALLAHSELYESHVRLEKIKQRINKEIRVSNALREKLLAEGHKPGRIWPKDKEFIE